jgi:hypothetical protein
MPENREQVSPEIHDPDRVHDPNRVINDPDPVVPDERSTHYPDNRRRRSTPMAWLVGLVVVAALIIGGFFVLGGDVDTDTDGQFNVDVPRADVDIDGPDVSVQTPDVDVDPGSIDIQGGDADADAGSNGG